MQKQEAYILDLLSGYINNTLSKEKVQELFDLLSVDQKSTAHFMNLPEVREKLEKLASLGRQEIPDLVSDRMRNRLLSAIEISEIQKSGPVIPRARVRSLIFTRVAAVAMTLLIIAPAAYLFIQSRNQKSVTPIISQARVIDIAPGNHNPVLTLSGGKQIILDSSVNKNLAAISNTNIERATTNELAYENNTSSGLIYNTLTNPRGSTVVSLSLSDGTRVWLNAGSSITYPTAFNAFSRDVEVTGEAYFEVTKNPHRPFTVKKEKQRYQGHCSRYAFQCESV